MEYLFQQGLKKPEIPRQRTTGQTPLERIQVHSASSPPGFAAPGVFSVDLESSLNIYSLMILYSIMVSLLRNCP
jgi:hypothetical protein